MPISSNPAVSVGLPVYNGEEFLKKAIDSLLSQTFEDFELIICDNCSTDSTQLICETAAKQDPRVSYHRNERNVGAAGNFNKVVELARGDYFAWANHDDLWADSYLEKCVAKLDEDETVALVYAQSAKIDANGLVVGELRKKLGLTNAAPARRLKQYHDLFIEIDRRKGWHEDAIEGLWIPVYGLMRISALQQTPKIGSYISSDTILLEELLILGRFNEIDETLFFKRDHPGRSMRASVSYDKRIDWFTGDTKKSKLIFPKWRLLYERFKVIGRVDLPIGQKMSCLSEMIAFYFRRSHEAKSLIKEILINVRRSFQLNPRTKTPVQKW